MLLLVVALTAQGQSPPPATRAEPKQKQSPPPQQAAADKRGAQESPLVVDVVPALKTQQEKDDDAREKREKASTDWWLKVFSGAQAFGNLIVAFITIALWVYTKRAAEAARDSAKAARESTVVATKVFIASHRPKIIVRRVVLSDDDVILYTAANIGSNDAKITTFTARVWLPKAGENLPARPPYANAVAKTMLLKGGESLEFQLVVEKEILEEHHFARGFYQTAKGRPNADPNATPPTLLFLGYIVYEDDLGQRRETAFLRQYDETTGRFAPIDHPDYEYQD